MTEQPEAWSGWVRDNEHHHRHPHRHLHHRNYDDYDDLYLNPLPHHQPHDYHLHK